MRSSRVLKKSRMQRSGMKAPSERRPVEALFAKGVQSHRDSLAHFSRDQAETSLRRSWEPRASEAAGRSPRCLAIQRNAKGWKVEAGEVQDEDLRADPAKDEVFEV